MLYLLCPFHGTFKFLWGLEIPAWNLVRRCFSTIKQITIKNAILGQFLREHFLRRHFSNDRYQPSMIVLIVLYFVSALILMGCCDRDCNSKFHAQLVLACSMLLWLCIVWNFGILPWDDSVIYKEQCYLSCMFNGSVQYIPRNMHTVLLCFALLWLCNRSYWFHMKYLSIFIRVALLALGQSLDCHSASEVSLVDMGKSVNV